MWKFVHFVTFLFFNFKVACEDVTSTTAQESTIFNTDVITTTDSVPATATHLDLESQELISFVNSINAKGQLIPENLNTDSYTGGCTGKVLHDVNGTTFDFIVMICDNQGKSALSGPNTAAIVILSLLVVFILACALYMFCTYGDKEALPWRILSAGDRDRSTYHNLS